MCELRIITYERAIRVVTLNNESPLLRAVKSFANGMATPEELEMLVANKLADQTIYQVPYVEIARSQDDDDDEGGYEDEEKE